MQKLSVSQCLHAKGYWAFKELHFLNKITIQHDACSSVAFSHARTGKCLVYIVHEVQQQYSYVMEVCQRTMMQDQAVLHIPVCFGSFHFRSLESQLLCRLTAPKTSSATLVVFKCKVQATSQVYGLSSGCISLPSTLQTA